MTRIDLHMLPKSRNAGAVASRTVNVLLYNMYIALAPAVPRNPSPSPIDSYKHLPLYTHRYTKWTMHRNVSRSCDVKYSAYFCRNSWLLGIYLLNIVVLYPDTKLYYIWRNHQRDKIWNVLSIEVRRYSDGSEPLTFFVPHY